MTIEEFLINGHLFDAHDARPRFELDDLIDEQKRVPMRQDLLNSL
jgi:hypothetical protein